MIELDYTFSSFEQWMSWTGGNRIFCDSPFISDLGRRIRRQGFIEPLTRTAVKPDDIVQDDSENWREGLIALGKNSRMRAVMSLLERELDGFDRQRVTIYAPEAVTALAMCLRSLFPRFLGSEYASTIAIQEDLYPIPHEDLTSLTLKSNAFDFVSTNEVLEHVPSIDAALAEIVRVLKPGGWHIGTHPFLFMSKSGAIRAQMIDGQVSFLMPPEYHGNPVGSSSLVFETPGWDILDRARSAGFSTAQMRFVASEQHGYVTENMGVFALCCQK